LHLSFSLYNADKTFFIVSQTFTPHDKSKPLRVRRSWLDVQNDPVYMEKLNRGYALMRALDGNSKSPNSLKARARVRFPLLVLS
jgi:hypothetical protein